MACICADESLAGASLQRATSKCMEKVNEEPCISIDPFFGHLGISGRCGTSSTSGLQGPSLTKLLCCSHIEAHAITWGIAMWSTICHLNNDVVSVRMPCAARVVCVLARLSVDLSKSAPAIPTKCILVRSMRGAAK